MNKRAKFWQYTGNHSNGKDCDRHDPHGYGLALIAYMANCGEEGDYQAPLTYRDTKQIRVTNHNNNGGGFGHEVTVSAPSDVWERARVSLLKLENSLT